jgi:hypothetical protein
VGNSKGAQKVANLTHLIRVEHGKPITLGKVVGRGSARKLMALGRKGTGIHNWTHRSKCSTQKFRTMGLRRRAMETESTNYRAIARPYLRAALGEVPRADLPSQ